MTGEYTILQGSFLLLTSVASVHFFLSRESKCVLTLSKPKCDLLISQYGESAA